MADTERLTVNRTLVFLRCLLWENKSVCLPSPDQEVETAVVTSILPCRLGSKVRRFGAGTETLLSYTRPPPLYHCQVSSCMHPRVPLSQISSGLFKLMSVQEKEFSAPYWSSWLPSSSLACAETWSSFDGPSCLERGWWPLSVLLSRGEGWVGGHSVGQLPTLETIIFILCLHEFVCSCSTNKQMLYLFLKLCVSSA